MSVGMALAERMLAARFNRHGHDIVDHRTFTIASDGDLEEGVASEACSLAGHLGLGQLVAFYDDNKVPIDGPTSQSLLRGRRQALRGLRVARPERRRGHVAGPLEEATRAAMAVEDRPVADHRPLAHRLRQPPQAGHLQRARLAAGRGRGAADQGVLRVGPRQALLRPRRGARPLPGVLPARARVPGRVGPPLRGLQQGVPRAGQAAAPDPRLRAARGVGRRRAEVRPRRQADRDPQGVRGGDSVGCRQGPVADRRVGRPGDLDQHRHPGGGDVEKGTYGGRNLRFGVREHGDGRDRQRPRPPRVPCLRGYVPDVLGLHEGRRSAVSADEAAGRSGSGRTTRSASARTAPRTSRSNSWPACGRCRG